MKKVKSLLSACVLTALLALAACGADPVIIVNKANPITSISRPFLKKLLLGKVLKWPSGPELVLFLGPSGQPERTSIIRAFCGMNDADYTGSFLHASFKGETVNQPRTMPSGPSIAQLVQMMPGAIGVVGAGDVNPGVKVIPLTAE